MLQFDDVSRVLTVAPQGELDHCMAERIRNTIDATVLKTDAKVVVFDLSEVGFMDSSGIGMMIGRYKFMKRRGGGVRVRGMRQPVERVFRMSGLGQIIKNEERTESK
ncbi:MAG: anti-sigma factor antagonist [Clostridia bacterium]|nr:anti-sigma factor antagonist [Clostridiales bacterium]MDO4387168.1 anti-sigma factor antagonist [Clostridia bacterium]MDO4827735.1 anti-sigma factor antagonist [Clostridia bacterium]MDY2768649.1 anti-sigma factor antagonist [Eubacteriales bacterium]